ncbi:hypothetical protein FGO68_gene7484 [Halteria grandinella]|uniref:histidine kinase n=1 Tax=Halteria grandinella TaxID=5974 RepID=A0A8J8NY86_HALGN|nr:hypothetical protein FGO68_gene7484 [Halteria grandinella]
MSPWFELENQRNLSQLKTVAFAQAAHEFRNPLNGIITSLQMLESIKCNEQERLYFNTALNCSRLMLSLVKDILDYSQIEAKSFILNPTNTNVKEILEECISIFKFKAKEKKIKLFLDTKAMPHQLFIDGSRLKQIIINLVSNAIKYTERGFVKIVTEQNGSMLSIAVQDTGVGMTENQIGCLFTNFTKIIKNRHLNRDGVGLGLAISQNIAQALGGNITVDSEPGIGSSFNLTVPYTKARYISGKLSQLETKKESSEICVGNQLDESAISEKIYSNLSSQQASPHLLNGSFDDFENLSIINEKYVKNGQGNQGLNQISKRQKSYHSHAPTQITSDDQTPKQMLPLNPLRNHFHKKK